jgi:hypothetical protein
MLRGTRQYVDVLGAGSGKVRATRQYADVLALLSFPVVQHETYTDTLGFVSGSGKDLNKGLPHTLTLNSEVVVGLDLVRFPTDSLGFEQTIAIRSPVSVTVEHSLALVEVNTTPSPVFQTVAQSFALSSGIVKHLVKTEIVTHSLALGETRVEVRDIPRSVTDSFDLTDVITRTVWIDYVDELSLVEEDLKRDTVDDSLGVVQTLAWGKGADVDDSLVFTQAVAQQLILNRAAVDTCGLTQAITYYVINRRFDLQYCPFVGSTVVGAPTPPPVTLTGPLTGITAPFQLVYPATGDVTDSVTLRAPEFGNKDRLAFNRVNREVRGGAIIVFADPMWPKIQTLVLTFTALRSNECQDLLTFLNDYAGMELGLIDWEKHYWKGVMVSDEVSVIEDSFDCYTVSFNFEGELDDTWSPQVIPVTPGTPRRRISQVYGRVPELEPIPPVEPTTEVFTAESDEVIVIGQPIYVKSTGHVAIADATTATTSGVAGFAITAAGVGEVVSYITEGKLTLTDWTAVASVAALTPGSNYFLSLTSGLIAASVVATGYHVRLGRATSTLTLDLEIEPSIKL